MIKPIREKEELVSIIKSLAKDLDARAEDIANDWNKKVRSINIRADIEIGNIAEWNITKNYGVIVLTDELVKDIEDCHKMIHNDEAWINYMRGVLNG